MPDPESPLDPFDSMRIWASMEARHFVLASEEMVGMDEDDMLARIMRLVQERMFCYRRGVDYAFYRHVNSRLREVGWIRKHAYELGFLVVLDLLHPEAATRKDAEAIARSNRLDKRDDPRAWMYDVRHRRRLMAAYPELFFEPAPEDAHRDKRRKPIRSVFKDLDLAQYQSPLRDIVVHVEQAARAKAFGSLPRHNQHCMEIHEVNSRLRLADAYDVEGLMDFERKMVECLDLILRELGDPSERYVWLVEDIRNQSGNVEGMYTFIIETITLRWFRERSEKEREKMLRKHYELRYSKEEAHRAVAANLAWYSPRVVEFQIWAATEMYATIRRQDIGARLLEELLAQAPLDEVGAALTHHNLGAQYGEIGTPRKALAQFKLALAIWTELDRPLDIGITKACIAVCYHSLGNKEESQRNLQDAFRLVFASTEKGQQMRGLVHLARGSLFCDRIDLTVKASERGMDVAMELEDDEYLLYFSGLLLNIQGKGIVGPLPAVTVPRAPSEFQLLKPTPFSYLPVIALRK